MARYIAKNLVAAKVADKLEIGLSYVIGVDEPTSIMINSYSSSKYSDQEIIELIRKVFPLTPKEIIQHLGLKKPLYKQVAAYGHFGRDDLDLPWEKLDKVEEIRKILNI
jgi:S-adenosylmethionine synthetase